MTKKQIIEDIEIAKRYLDGFHLLVPENKILLDCIFIAPFHWKSFFIQVEIKNGKYHASCAFPHYSDFVGCESFSGSFENVEKKDRHAAIKGDVFCKIIQPDKHLIEAIIQQVKEYKAANSNMENIVVIDGITARVRLYEHGCVIRDVCLYPADNDEKLLDMLISFSETI